MRYRLLKRRSLAGLIAQNFERDMNSCETDWRDTEPSISRINLLALAHQAFQLVDDPAMQDEFTHILRVLNEVIAESSARPPPRIRSAHDLDTQARRDMAIAKAKYHAEQLGLQIAEVAECLASGTLRRQYSQARPRGRERFQRERQE